MTELNIELDESGKVYFLTCVKFEDPQPEGDDKPIGWLPVFRTAEAARAYMPGGQINTGQVGELTFPILGDMLQS